MISNRKNRLHCILLFVLCFLTMNSHNSVAIAIAPPEIEISTTDQNNNHRPDDNYHWCTGREYKYTYQGFQGTPYFNDNANFKGEVCFLGQRHFCNQLFLDIVEEKLVIASFINDAENTRLRYVTLNSSWVQQCSLYTAHDTINFVYLNDPINNIPKGFYELIWDSTTKIIIHHTKIKNQNASGSSLNQGFTYERVIFVQEENHLIKIKGKRDFYKHYKSHRKEIMAFFNHYRKPFTSFTKKELIELFSICTSI